MCLQHIILVKKILKKLVADPSFSVQILSFPCSFWQTFCKIICWRTPPDPSLNLQQIFSIQLKKCNVRYLNYHLLNTNNTLNSHRKNKSVLH